MAGICQSHRYDYRRGSMTRNEYLAKLESELGLMSYKDVKDILDEINDHFAEGIAKGKTEEKIAEELGSPVELAKAYREGNGNLPSALRKKEQPQPEQANKSDSNTGGILFVLLFNIFVGIPVFIAVVSAILTLIGIEVGLVAGLILLCLSLPAWGNFLLTGIFLALTLLFTIVFMAALIFFPTKYFIIGTKMYIEWNAKVWKEGF